MRATGRAGRAAGSTVVEIFDASDMSGLGQRLPAENERHRYRLRDAARARSSSSPLCRHTLRVAGDLQVSWVEERLGTQIEVLEPGIAAHCFVAIRSGAMALTQPHGPAAQAGPGRGLIHGGRSGTAAVTQDGTARSNLWVSSARIEAALAAYLGEAPRAPVVFHPSIDWMAGAGPTVQRLMAHGIAEFERAGGLATQPLALAAFTDLFVHTVLNGLPHNYSDRLERAAADTAPGHVRRAEAFMRAQATQPIRLADIAAAAGCSVRSLQNAFRAFRDTTPHDALQGIRLELAREALLDANETIGAVGRRFGFSNAGRFSTLYARRFGTGPRSQG